VTDDPPKAPPRLDETVGRKATRKLNAKRKGAHGIWFGFATFGLVGWTVAVPTLLGAALGMWLDRHHPTSQSWTLNLLLIGLIGGCVAAYRWVSSEQRAIGREQGDEDDDGLA
jgi:ATP synthase protein I